jgi:hypothetical protein
MDHLQGGWQVGHARHLLLLLLLLLAIPSCAIASRMAAGVAAAGSSRPVRAHSNTRAAMVGAVAGSAAINVEEVLPQQLLAPLQAWGSQLAVADGQLLPRPDRDQRPAAGTPSPGWCILSAGEL